MCRPIIDQTFFDKQKVAGAQHLAKKIAVQFHQRLKRLNPNFKLKFAHLLPNLFKEPLILFSRKSRKRMLMKLTQGVH